VIKSYVDNLLSGKVNKLSEFHDQISDGKWINDALGGKDLFDLKDAAQKAFAAVLLPQAWKLNKDTVPVILMEDKDCNLGEPIQEMNFDTTHATGSCVIAGKTMWLVGLNTEQCRTGPNPFGPGGNKPDPCPVNVFRTLPGFDKLGDFGFSKDDIIAGAYAGYQLNGNKNGYQVDPNSRVKDGSGAEGSFPFSNGILTPGVFNIPICDIHQAVEAYKNGKGGATPLCDYGTQ